MRRVFLVLDALLILGVLLVAACIAPIALPWALWREKQRGQKWIEANGHHSRCDCGACDRAKYGVPPRVRTP